MKKIQLAIAMPLIQLLIIPMIIVSLWSTGSSGLIESGNFGFVIRGDTSLKKN
jgi:hypothetical protein